jgi:hypothetical protein
MEKADVERELVVFQQKWSLVRPLRQGDSWRFVEGFLQATIRYSLYGNEEENQQKKPTRHQSKKATENLNPK